MKRAVFPVLVCIVFSVFFCDSCASVQGFSGGANFCGLVTDTKNHPVNGYRIKLSGRGSPVCDAVSNANGVFVFKNVPQGNYELSGNTSGWAKIAGQKVNFYNRTDITCVQVQSFEELCSECEAALYRGDYHFALTVLDRVSDENSENLLVRFYCAAAHYKSGNHDAAEKILKKMKKDFPAEKHQKNSSENLIVQFYELAHTRGKK